MVATNTVIHAVTREDYDLIMQWAEKEGYTWYGGQLPTDVVNFYFPDIGIYLNARKQLEYSRIGYFEENAKREGWTILSMEEFFTATLPSIPTWPW